MTNAYLQKLKILKNTQANLKNEELIRNLSCEIAALAPEKEKSKAMAICLRKLRELKNEKGRTQKACQMKRVNLGKLFENAILSADIILSEKGKRIEFSFENEERDCDPEAIIDTFLNLISNSAKFGKGENIRAELFKKEGFCCFKIKNEGAADFSSFSSGGGIASCKNIARLHGGRLLFSTDGKTTCSGFSILHRDESFDSWQGPSFTDYLEDSFSPVRVGLCDVEARH